MKYISFAVFAALTTCSFGDFKGRVTLSDGRPAKEAVVYLVGGGIKPKPLPHAAIDQRNKKFTPHVLAVTVGTTVDFPNSDYVFHNVFAEYQAKRFDLGMYPRGSSKRQKFDKPGLVALFCSIHSDMSAYIYVVDTPHYALADAKGSFHIKNVPPGTYKLRVWHESGEVLEKSVVISGEETIDIQTKRQ